MSLLDSMMDNSNMNFHNWKLPVKGKSRVFKPQHSSREGATEYVKKDYVCPYSLQGEGANGVNS